MKTVVIKCIFVSILVSIVVLTSHEESVLVCSSPNLKTVLFIDIKDNDEDMLILRTSESNEQVDFVYKEESRHDHGKKIKNQIKR